MTCFADLSFAGNWQTFLSLPKPRERLLCTVCSEALETVVSDASCGSCAHAVEVATDTCNECMFWWQKYAIRIQHVALYRYNIFAKSITWKIKHNHDYALIALLGSLLRNFVVEHYDLRRVVFVPYPTDEGTLHKRGMWITEQILLAARLPILHLLQQNEISAKQHKLDKIERLGTAHRKLVVTHGIKGIGEKTVIIFDDIYTTGATVVSAYRALRAAGINNLESVSIFR